MSILQLRGSFEEGECGQRQKLCFCIADGLAESLVDKGKNGFVLSNQILKSGNSIGANIEEAIRRQSKRDFTEKLLIMFKELMEFYY